MSENRSSSNGAIHFISRRLVRKRYTWLAFVGQLNRGVYVEKSKYKRRVPARQIGSN